VKTIFDKMRTLEAEWTIQLVCERQRAFVDDLASSDSWLGVIPIATNLTAREDISSFALQRPPKVTMQLPYDQ
jgi:hypothetical protein